MRCFFFYTHVLGSDGASLSPQATYVLDTKSLPLLDPNLPEAALSRAATLKTAILNRIFFKRGSLGLGVCL